MAAHWTALSKAVSRALRHQPQRLGLELDDEGWVGIGALVEAMRRDHRWRDLTRADVAEMVRKGSKQRHEIEGDRIRALYGHSVSGKIVRQPDAPPQLLFHGTAAASASRILAAGLEPMGRQYVHLSVDRATAFGVGRRKSREVAVLVVAAAAAHDARVTFYRGNADVWLTDRVPPAFITLD